MDYLIEIGLFSGPFDLLFQLIEKNEIDINNLPISEITTQYINHMNLLQSIDMDSLSEFMLLAATLLEIKSKMLLPVSNGENADDEEDPRDELVQKLIEYKKFKQLASMLDQREQDFSKILYRNQIPSQLLDFPANLHQSFDFDFSEKALLNALAELLSNLDSEDLNRKRYFKQIAPDNWTVEEKIRYLKDLFKHQKSMIFTKLFQSDSTKGEIITTFLALLELIRIGEICVRQQQLFTDILIIKTEAGEWQHE